MPFFQRDTRFIHSNISKLSSSMCSIFLLMKGCFASSDSFILSAGFLLRNFVIRFLASSGK